MVSVLSGGEKSRLYLCQLIHQNPNLLIMDEPTNHLDIDMADALLEALKQYKGTVIFVSHDRWFLSELASKFWVFTKVSAASGIHTTVVEPDCDWQQAIALAFSEPEKEKTVAPPREKKKRSIPGIWNSSICGSRNSNKYWPGTKTIWNPSTSSFQTPPPTTTRAGCKACKKKCPAWKNRFRLSRPA